MTPAGAEAVAELARLHALAFSARDAWGADAIGLMLAMPGAFAWRADGGFVLARAVAGEAEVLTLAVVPEARRQGLGAALVVQAMAGAAARGATVLFLEVSAENSAARALYAALGFGEIGRRRRYYADGSDALMLSHPLFAEKGG